MLPLHLSDQILAFIDAFKVVEERQVMQFFKNPWGKQKVEYELGYLKRSSRVFEHRMNPNDENEPIKLSTVRTLHTPLKEFRRTITAVSIMCQYHSDEITFYDSVPYPNEIIFITSNDIIYEVSVFDNESWVGKYAMTRTARGKNLPDGEKDPTNYIAIVPIQSIVVTDGQATVPEDSMIKKIDKLGFSMYATVDRNGHAELYSI